MDKDTVVAYIDRQDNEWEATDHVISEAFSDMRIGPDGKRTTPNLPFSMYDWRQDYYAWGKWAADVRDDWWVGTDEYNAARGWHEQLKQWQARIPKLVEPIPAAKAPVPEKEDTVLHEAGEAGAKAAKGVGVWIAGGLVAAAFIYSRKTK